MCVHVPPSLILCTAHDNLPSLAAGPPSHSLPQIWRYSYPTMAEAVPDWEVPLLTVALPLLVLALACLLGAASRQEALTMALALGWSVVTAGLVANLLKTQVPEPGRGWWWMC